MCATLSIVAGLAAPALGLAGCGGDDDGKSASTTATKRERTQTVAAGPKPSGPPKVPAKVAGDVDSVSRALEGAGYTVKPSRGSGGSLAQLQVGETLVTFYASVAAAAKDAAAFKQLLAQGPGRGAVRASGKRVYLTAKKADERFAKIVSTAEAAL